MYLLLSPRPPPRHDHPGTRLVNPLKIAWTSSVKCYEPGVKRERLTKEERKKGSVFASSPLPGPGLSFSWNARETFQKRNETGLAAGRLLELHCLHRQSVPLRVTAAASAAFGSPKERIGFSSSNALSGHSSSPRQDRLTTSLSQAKTREGGSRMGQRVSRPPSQMTGIPKTRMHRPSLPRHPHLSRGFIPVLSRPQAAAKVPAWCFRAGCAHAQRDGRPGATVYKFRGLDRKFVVQSF